MNSSSMQNKIDIVLSLRIISGCLTVMLRSLLRRDLRLAFAPLRELLLATFFIVLTALIV